jgi:hypothetical protein
VSVLDRLPPIIISRFLFDLRQVNDRSEDEDDPPISEYSSNQHSDSLALNDVKSIEEIQLGYINSRPPSRADESILDATNL